MQNKTKKQGSIAGIALLIMAIVAGFTFGFAHSLLVADSPELTFQNLLANKPLFLAELSGWSIIFILDALVAIALYFFFRSTAKQASLVTAVIRLAYTLLLGIAIIHLFRIIPNLSVSTSFPNEHIVSETYSHLQLFEKIWSIGLIVFGLHLIGLGYLLLKSKLAHGIFGYLLYLGGISYTLVHSLKQLSSLNPEFISTIEEILILPMTLAEMLFAFWLIYQGFRKSTRTSNE